MFEQQTLYRLSCTSDSENLWELTAECFGLHKQTQNSKVQICSQHSLNIFAVTHSHSPLFFFFVVFFLCISWEQKDVCMTTTTTVTQLKLGEKNRNLTFCYCSTISWQVSGSESAKKHLRWHGISSLRVFPLLRLRTQGHSAHSSPHGFVTVMCDTADV